MITVLFGPNRYLVHQKLAAITKEFKKTHGEAGIERYAAEKIEPAQLGGMLAGATLFASNRMVVLDDLAAHKQLAEALAARLQNIPPEVHVVLVERQLDKRTIFYKELKKHAELYECKDLDEQAAVMWVTTAAKSESAVITPANARLLVRYAGSDQSSLSQEVAKLAAYSKEITAETIELLIEKRPEETIFQLLDLALSGRASQALAVLEGLERAHEDPFQVANMLMWQIHILALVSAKGAPEDAQITKEAKLSPFVIKKTRTLARTLSGQQQRHMLDVVAELDITLKSTGQAPWRLIEHAVASF